MSLFKKNNFGKKSFRRKLERNRDETDNRRDDDDDDDVTISLKLGNIENIFANGVWIPQNKNDGQVGDENLNLKRSVNDLEEKNNLLRLKYEILMDMLLEHLTSVQRI